MIEQKVPTFKDVEAASKRIFGHAHRTPVLTSSTLNNEMGASVFLKCENMQRMGAFKFRGAFNALTQFSAEQKKLGVITFSSGNHAQAIALSGKLLNIPASIIMPKDAPSTKIEATRSYGAKVILYDRYLENREDIGSRLANEFGMTLIPPYDHLDVIAGQGTAALELIQDIGQIDALFVCLGGGGLLAGSALATHKLSPNCQIYGVEPEAGNDGQQSFIKGEIVRIEVPKTIADGAQTQYLGNITFPIIRRYATDILTVTDDQLIQSMRFLASRMKIIAEPTGCLGLAAARSISNQLKGKRVGVIISGGNIDLSKFLDLTKE